MDIGTKRGLDLATDFFQKNKNQLLNLSKENLIEKDRVV